LQLNTSNLRVIGLGLLLYSAENDGYFPLRMDINEFSIFSKYASRLSLDAEKWRALFICPSAKQHTLISYVYIPGMCDNTSPPVPILYDNLDNHPDYGNILYSDGYVKHLEGKNKRSRF